MKINFRQGILRYQYAGPLQQFLLVNGSVVDLLADDSPLEVAIAHRGSDYLHIEPQTVLGAWSFTGGVDNWLYIDIDRRTGERTFGSTTVAPVINITAPASPVEDLHWFDIDDGVMYVYTNGSFREHIRVFVAQLDSAGTFISLGTGLPNLPFAGTQVGIQGPTVDTIIGRLLYDGDGKVVHRDNKELMTTESQFFVTGSKLNAVKIESAINTAPAGETIPEYHVAKVTAAGRLELANYEDTGLTVLSMCLQNATIGQEVDIVIQGTVINPAWNFTNIGQPLWVDEGLLVEQDPHVVDSIGHPQGQVPVARVLKPDTIVFEQGLGGVGPVGPPGSVGTLPVATVVTDGAVRMSLPPVNPFVAIAVGDNDSRLTDDRNPLPHVHAADTVAVTPVGDVTATEVQSSIQQLDNDKLAKTGGTMSGALNLFSNPTTSLEAATKQYVDSLVSGLVWKEPLHHVNLISDSITDPSLITTHTSDLYIVPTGAVGVWTGLDGKFVLWDGASWIDLGLVSDHPVGLRLGVAMETPTTPSGSMGLQQDKIAVLTNPYAPTFSYVSPILNEAVYVNNAESLHAYHQYVYDGNGWVEFGGHQEFTAGNNIKLSGNILDVKQFFEGGNVDAGTLQGNSPAAFSPAVHSHVIDDLTDVTITTPNQKQIMQYVGTEWVNVDLPHDLTFSKFGTMTGSETIGLHQAAKDFVIPQNGNKAYADVPCTSPSVQLDITKNGLPVGNIIFASTNTVGVVNLSADITMNVDDVLKINAPAAPDASLADVQLTFLGKEV